jgi:hypothetical protein
MAKTQDDLVSAVLSELVRMGAGQMPAPEDVTSVAAELQPIVDELIARRVTSTFTLSAIPTMMFRGLVRLCALYLGPMFGKVMEPAAFDAAIASAEERLRELSRLDRTAPTIVLAVLEQLEVDGASSDVLDATAISNRLPQILGELARRQVVYIPNVDSVPDEMVPDLARYVAASVATPQLYPVMSMAESRLRRIDASYSKTEPVRAEYF